MTLTHLLEIKISLLNFEDLRSLAVAERLWNKAGMPSEPGRLCSFLEQTLKHLVEDGVGYPKVLLKRKKQLDRREWCPRRQSEIATPRPKSINGCPQCGGNGIRVIDGGKHGTLCECGAWRKK
jgi:hypothetical protein